MILKSIKSFKYAFKGIYLVFRNEPNAKVHTTATVFVIVVSFVLKIERWEWLWMLLSVALVWITESLNSAIEKVVDFISPAYHEKAGQIKDMAAGAVLIAAFFALLTAAIIFIPRMLG